MIPEPLIIALGCALGGIARYALSTLIDRRHRDAFPLGTMVVNVSGAFVIGLVAALLAAADETDSSVRAFAVVGFLGSYTTVSAFSLQTATLLRSGKRGRALVYVMLSVALCLAAVAFGAALGATMVTGA